MEKEQKDYIKAFNNGYFLAQYNPQLLNQITNGLDRNNLYCDGPLSGKEQYDIEKAKSYFKKFERNSPGEDRSIEKDRNKGLDYNR